MKELPANPEVFRSSNPCDSYEHKSNTTAGYVQTCSMMFAIMCNRMNLPMKLSAAEQKSLGKGLALAAVKAYLDIWGAADAMMHWKQLCAFLPYLWRNGDAYAKPDFAQSLMNGSIAIFLSMLRSQDKSDVAPDSAFVSKIVERCRVKASSEYEP